MSELFFRKCIKNIGFILVILGHYYFCGYVLSEVHEIKDNDPVVVKVYEDKSDKKTEDKNTIGVNENVNKVLVNEKTLDKDYLGMIEIPKINLKKNLYNIDSYQNDVNKNIEVLKASVMPNVVCGNFILAAHSGNTSLGYFRNLHDLKVGDEIFVNYKDDMYAYEVAKVYDVLKTGKVAIKRDKSKTTITLITCLGNDRQLVVIGYLK